MKLYLFNPDHDLALARSEGRYDVLKSAFRFAADCASLPLWYADEGASVLAECDEAWRADVVRRFPALTNVGFVLSAVGASPIVPWGWNVHLRNILASRGAVDLPTDETLALVKRLSHRRVAAEALECLRLSVETTLPDIPRELFSMQEVDSASRNCLPLIFKAPWSGSGKGLFRLADSVPPGFGGWARNIIECQHSVMVERFYDKVQDFAMEFRVDENGVSFAGYSLFSTSVRGAYACNELLSDEMIVARLNRYVSTEILEQVKTGLLRFFNERYFPVYRGYLGVDMMVYVENGAFRLHPCVEINARMTMGVVARLFYDRFVESGMTGSFEVNYFATAEEMARFVHRMSHEYPLNTENGRIRAGWLSLCPVTDASQYAVSVLIGEKNRP